MEAKRRAKKSKRPVSTAVLKRSSAQVQQYAFDRRFTRKLLRTDTPGGLQTTSRRERTYNLTQSQLLQQTNATTRSKAGFSLELSRTNLAPYILTRFSRSGRTLLLASEKGHLATINWRAARQHSELFLNETIRDATFLHNDLFHAVAQRKYTYIYDGTGTQLHVLRHCRNPVALSYLPYHYLLASLSSDPRRISWTDTSTGQIVADTAYPAALRSATALSSPTHSGVVASAHVNGTVSLWSPASPQPLARIFCHSGGVQMVTVSPDGSFLVTCGGPAEIKLWDVKTFQCRGLICSPAPVSSMAVSQRNLLAFSHGSEVNVHARFNTQVRRSTSSSSFQPESKVPVVTPASRLSVSSKNGGGLYMRERYGDAQVTSLTFCPFEDVLSVCLYSGLRTMIVPGAGEANWDTSGPHPYEGRKERREKEVRGLLDKLPPETIMLDEKGVGAVEGDARQRLRERKAAEKQKLVGRVKKKTKGRSKIGKRLKRKQANVMDAKKAELLQRLEKQRKEKERERKADVTGNIEPVLRRFVRP